MKLTPCSECGAPIIDTAYGWMHANPPAYPHPAKRDPETYASPAAHRWQWFGATHFANDGCIPAGRIIPMRGEPGLFDRLLARIGRKPSYAEDVRRFGPEDMIEMQLDDSKPSLPNFDETEPKPWCQDCNR